MRRHSVVVVAARIAMCAWSLLDRTDRDRADSLAWSRLSMGVLSEKDPAHLTMFLKCLGVLACAAIQQVEDVVCLSGFGQYLPHGHTAKLFRGTQVRLGACLAVVPPKVVQNRMLHRWLQIGSCILLKKPNRP